MRPGFNKTTANSRLVTLSALLFLLSTTPAQGAELETHGYLLFNYSGRINSERPSQSNSDFLLGEERLRLDLSAWSETGDISARFKGEVLHDAVDNETEIELREIYLDVSSSHSDLRIGRQIITWGVGDLLFINDVFPKNWQSFFSGRPLGYLKTGVDGARLRYSGQTLNVELIALPFFTPDTLPDPKRFSFFDPMAGVTDRAEIEPTSTFNNTEWAMRLYRRVGEFDVAAYLYKGFWRSPAMQPDSEIVPSQLTLFYPELNVFGASAQGNVFGGVLSLEVGYYDSRGDSAGVEPAIPNSQSRLLIGYQRQLNQDLTLGVQYYAEIMQDHGQYQESLPAGFPVQRRYRDIVTLRLEQFLKHQTLRLSFFSFYSPADRDYLIQPQAHYKLSDELGISLGANIFGGKRDTSFLGQFGKNDNVYLALRFDF